MTTTLPLHVKPSARHVYTATFPRSTTQFLERPGGRIAYDDTGAGPLIVAVPALGDLRSSYRHLKPLLVQAGFRVVTMDVRGMGDSSTNWNDYSAMAIGSDLVALISHLDAHSAIVMGNSHGGGAAVWAAVIAPGLVRGLVLLDAFVQDTPLNFWMWGALKLALADPWGARGWLALFAREFAAKPKDYETYRAVLARNLEQPGRMASVRGMIWATKAPIAERLDDVTVPTLVLMGAKDPDFPKPAEAAEALAKRLHGRAFVIEGAGHYPHAEKPERVAARVLEVFRPL